MGATCLWRSTLGWARLGQPPPARNIKVTNQLKIISKSTTIEPTRNYQQSPLVIVSENFDCVDEVITLIFEEKINISYILIKTTKNYETYNQIKSINIKAY